MFESYNFWTDSWTLNQQPVISFYLFILFYKDKQEFIINSDALSRPAVTEC